MVPGKLLRSHALAIASQHAANAAGYVADARTYSEDALGYAADAAKAASAAAASLARTIDYDQRLFLGLGGEPLTRLAAGAVGTTRQVPTAGSLLDGRTCPPGPSER